MSGDGWRRCSRGTHETLRANLAHMVEKQEGGEVGKLSIAELIAGRDWLFENASYQIDVSHLHATVRFGRALKADDPELPLAIELADYGARLDPQFHYPPIHRSMITMERIKPI